MAQTRIATLATSGTSWRRRMLGALKLALVAAVLWGVRRSIAGALTELGQRPLEFDWPWLALAGGLYLLGILPSGLFFQAVLVEQGGRPHPGQSLRAYYLGQLGKYVPGKAAVVVIRAALSAGPGVSIPLAAAAVFYETLSFMAVGAGLALAVVIGGVAAHAAWVTALALAALATAVPLVPAVFRRLIALLPRAVRADESLSAFHMRAGVLCRYLLANAAGWCLLGLSLWAVLRGLGYQQGSAVSLGPVCLAAVGSGVVAGFLALIPAGAVVREGVMLQLLLPVTGQALAVAAPLVLRLVWLVFELGLSAILVWWRPVAGATGAPPAVPPGAPRR